MSLQKYLFINQETGYRVVIDICDVITSGLPIDPETEEELELVGIVDDKGNLIEEIK